MKDKIISGLEFLALFLLSVPGLLSPPLRIQLQPRITDWEAQRGHARALLDVPDPTANFHIDDNST